MAGKETVDSHDNTDLSYTNQQSNKDIEGPTRKYHEGQTALFYAVQQSNNESVVRALIDAGAEVNATDKDGQTALFYAVQQSDNESVVRALVDAGAEVNTTDKDGQTALFYAVQQSNNESVVRALIDAGAEVNATDKDGQTALFYAVQQNNNESVVRALVDAGAEVNTTDKDGQTALFYVVQQSDNESVVRALVDADAEVNTADKDGQTALFYAVQPSENESVVRALIDAGAEVNTTDKDGQTALFYAVQQNNNESVVRALVDAGAEVNTSDKDGQTALFYAVQQNNNESVVRALVDAGAEVNTSDKDGQTALFYAVQQNNNESVVRALVNSCDDIFSFRDIYGRTALFYADWTYFIAGSYILEKGGNRWLQSRDTCDVDILTLLCEKYATSREQRFDAKVLMENGVKRESIVTTVLNMMLRKSVKYSVFNLKSETFHESFLNLVHLYDESINDDNLGEQKLKMENIMKLLEQGADNVPKALELLVELGANANSADSDGNTALHHAVRLQFLGASEELVLGLCHQLDTHDAKFNTRNHQNQTPLLFCLSGDISRLTESELPSAIKTVRKVCMFLLKRGSSVEETSRNGESVFHLIMKLFQVGLEIQDKTIRQEFLQEVIEILQLFPRAKVFKGNVVNKCDVHVQTPLHLWAKLAIKESLEDYHSDVIKDCSFEGFLQIVFNHLLGCGAVLVARNKNESTPLHLCMTWSAVKILIKAGANPNDVDALGQTPLLVAAKERRHVSGNRDRFYPDFSEDPKSFWKNCISIGWAVEKNGESVLSILIQSETFILAKALVDVACEMHYTQSETVTTDLLNAICKDDSTRTHWKSVLVQDILKSIRKYPTTAVTPLRFCCANILEQATSQNSSAELYSTVHCEILKLLQRYGANLDSCFDMAETCPGLKDLLMKPVDIDTLVLIPWTSMSKKHEDKLAKVARRQESHVVGQFWLHNDHIGFGSFGYVFAGINEKDGREVAIKRIEKIRMERQQIKREITNLTALADCEQVLRYLQFLDGDDHGHFSYIVLELMEGNLDHYLTGSTHDPRKGIGLCEHVIKGMEYLQNKNILHRDLKPGNILYKTHPKLCLKIADFGLSLRMDLKATTVYGTNAGTRCWIAPEVLMSEMDHCKSSDMFSCGLLLHYILSVQKHPFSPGDCAGKGEYQIAHETESNIMKGEMEGWDESLSPEATHLVRNILGSDVKDRPTAAQALDHPMFWSNNKKIDFLTAVGNQSVFEYPRAKRSTCLSAIEADLETNFMTIVRKGTWNDPGYVHMPVIFAEMRKKRRYDVHSVVELVRFIRNVYAHVSEHTIPTAIRKLLLEDFVVLEYFPDLVIEVYKVVTTHGWDQTKEEVKYSLKLFRSHDADSESCFDMAETYPGQKDLLMKSVDIDTPVLIHWTPVSKKHEDKLAKVARRQESHVVGQFWLHNDHIGFGSFGYVFAGINEKDGREVAIKRIEKLRMQRPQDKREITNLTALADCEQVLRYLKFLDDDHGPFSYIVLELMEGNLDDYLTGSTHDPRKGIGLCEEVIKGMEYLQNKNILHRDLKPGNILYKTHPKLCLKIADFGLSRRIDVYATTVYGTNAGTRCWIAPEVLKSEMDHCKSSDMFSCGLLLHYILSVQKHPFSPGDCAGKGDYQIAHETESNIMKGEMEGWDESLSPEATHLVRNILGSDVKDRPTAAQALDYPMFWSNNKKIDFLTAVGNQSVFEYPRAGRLICLSAIETDLETSFKTIVRKGTWNDPGYVHMPVIFAEMRKKRRYDVHSVVELVRFIRNVYAHVSEHTRPTAIRKLLLEDFVVLEYFPDLVMEVYKVATAHGWDQTKEEVKYSMNK